ncbi:MAG: hypothetical protein H7Y13_11985 [Sphingobacteriaceae bacterium]|nr:hypothetical protein [Sphingobacteriaceae bacterium]
MTRRTLVPRSAEAYALMVNMNAGLNLEKSKKELIRCCCPYGKPGDIHWVRETWRYSDSLSEPYNYKADYVREYNQEFIDRIKGSWKPSIHMPKDGSRIWLQITGISIERLQDISAFDAMWEGIESSNEDFTSEEGALHADWKNYTWRDDPRYEDYHFPTFVDATESYRTLWEKINGKDSWNQNPWVWVISFNVLSKTGYEDLPEDIRQQLEGKEVLV